MHGLVVVLTRLKTEKNALRELKRVVVGRINGVVALTGCFLKKMYGRFAGPKKVVVITRWSYY